MQSLFNVNKNWTIYEIVQNHVKSCKIISFFSLWATEAFFGKHSGTFMVGNVFAKNINSKNSLTTIDSTIDFWLGLK